MPKTLEAFLNKPAIAFSLLFLFALFLNREGAHVPAGNENVYLLYLIKAWRSTFLATDWTFQESTAGHPVFNLLFGWPTRLLPLAIVGWIGRFASWTFLFIALMRIGKHFRIPTWMVFISLFLWLVQRQSFVANEWIIGTFEAKCVGYACLLFAIDSILRGQVVAPAILTGLAFTFHSAIGLWGGGAVALAFATQYPLKQTAKFFIIAALFALPGLLTSLYLVFGSHPISPAEAKFMVLTEMPFHLDPFTFGKAKIVVLFLMLLFNFLHSRANRQDQKLKFLIRFEIFTALFFLLGILMRALNQFSIVELFPFRVFAVLIMLFFFWHLAAVYQHRHENKPAGVLVLLGIFTFLCLPSPVMRLQGLLAYDLQQWRQQPDDFQIVANWVSNHSPDTAVVIAPPWRKDTFYYVRRPLVADWHDPRFTAMTEWRQRIESLVGDVSNMDIEDNLAGEMDDRARQFYASLTMADVFRIKEKYGGDILITPTVYNLPLLTESGTYRAYNLSP